MKSVKTRFSYFLFLTFSLAITPLLVQAETKYVSDHLVITVRTGQGTEYQIIKTLGSGEHVDVLETTDNGYSHVVTRDGTEGWVSTQYLENEPVASERLITVQAQLKEAKTELKKINQSYSDLDKKYNDLFQNQEKLSAAKTKLDAELARVNDIAKRPIILDKLNRTLQDSNVNLEKDLQRLNQENHSLKDRSQREWFIVGALVLFGGIFLGLIIPKLRGRKRSNW